MFTVLAALVLFVTLQVLLVVKLADKLTPDASVSRGDQAGNAQAGGRYAQFA